MNQEENSIIKTPHSKVVKIYYLLFFTNLLINLDHGIIPAASLKIEESLDISDELLGVLGSLVYAGIVVMGIFAGPLFLRYSAKKLIHISLFTMMISLGVFTLKLPDVSCYLITRFLTGVSQAPLLVYFPVWVDHHGGQEKTMWLTLLQVGVPFGVFTGYVLSGVVSTNWEWQWSFYLQLIIMAPCLIAFILVPTSSIDIRIKLNKDTQVQGEESTFQNSLATDYSKLSYFSLLRILLQSKVYVCVMLSLCVAYFIVTGVQFWISNYMETVLHQPQALVNTVFSVVSISAPTLGCIAGGVSVQLTGGYESRFALPICFLFTIFSVGVSIPIPFIDNFWLVSALIWVQLFCGGASVPPCTGIMISSVVPSMRSFANSNTTTFVNLLGYLPAPSIFGFIAKSFGKRKAMMFLMFYPMVGFATILAAMIIQIRQRSSQESQKLIIGCNSEQYVADQNQLSINQEPSHVQCVAQAKPIKSTTLQVEQPDGGTYQLLNDGPNDIGDSIIKQIFEYHTVQIQPGVPINQEILTLPLTSHTQKH